MVRYVWSRRRLFARDVFDLKRVGKRSSKHNTQFLFGTEHACIISISFTHQRPQSLHESCVKGRTLISLDSAQVLLPVHKLGLVLPVYLWNARDHPSAKSQPLWSLRHPMWSTGILIFMSIISWFVILRMYDLDVSNKFAGNISLSDLSHLT